MKSMFIDLYENEFKYYSTNNDRLLCLKLIYWFNLIILHIHFYIKLLSIDFWFTKAYY